MGSETITQGSHTRRCNITLGAAANLLTAVIAAFEAQAAGRGTAIQSRIIGGKILTSTAGFTFGDNATLSTMVTIAASTAYSAPSVNFLADTWVAGSGTMTVEVYYDQSPTVP